MTLPKGKYIFYFLIGLFLCGVIGLFSPSSVSAESVTDTYLDTTKINTGVSTNYVVTGGQLKMVLNNGAICTAADQCTSGFCADGVCCNTACTGSTCQRCDSNSNAGAGTCGYISTAVDPDNECGATGCFTGNCSGTGYACGYSTSGTGNCSSNCQTCVGATSGSCVTATSYAEGYNCTAACTGCSSGSCVNIPNASQDTYGSNTCTAAHYRCNGAGACTAPVSTPVSCCSACCDPISTYCPNYGGTCRSMGTRAQCEYDILYALDCWTYP